MAENFADRLMAAIQEKRSRVCAGIDPVPERLPAPLQPEGGRWTEQGLLVAVDTFCQRITEAVADSAAAVKFNSAFFEALGGDGPALLDGLLRATAEDHPELVTIVDAKRSDIGSTAAAYARAVFRQHAAEPGQPPDAVTANPYLGSDGVLPFIEQAQQLDAGVFVLVKTSNPSSAEIQDLEAGGKPVYLHVAELVNRWGEDLIGESGYSSVGAVVGATYPEQLAELRQVMARAPFLVPGYGAQGGGPADVVGAFDDEGLGAIVNSSRGIIYAYADDKYASKFGADRFAEAAAQATEDMRVAINKGLGL